MIKKFDQFLEEGIYATGEVDARTGTPIMKSDGKKTPNKIFGIVETGDVDNRTSTKVMKSWRIDVVSKEGAIEAGDYDATIYVLPDDTVEIRNIDSDFHIQGVMPKLTGDMVRKNDLHRCKWIIRIA